MAKGTNKTKAQLVAEIDLLRDKIKDLMHVEKEEKSRKKNIEANFADIGLSLIKEDGIYKLVKIGFCRDTKEAEVISIEDADKNPRSFALAEYRFDEAVTELIIRKING